MGRVIEYFMTGFVCNRKDGVRGGGREGVRGGGGGRDGVRGGGREGVRGEGREGNVSTLSPLRQRVSRELACRERFVVSVLYI